MREKSFGFTFWLTVIISYFLFCSKAEEDEKTRQTFVIRYKDEDQTIPVTVVLDYKKQTEYVINMNPRTPAKSVTLYDFKQRTIAYKDLTNRECFLGRLTHETLSEESNALQDVKNPVEVKPKIRSLDPRLPALTPTEIRNIAGQKTAAFCRKMNTWLLIPEKSHKINKRETDEELEEHTLQYHGHRSSQYSHYERQTRRKFRNRGHANHRRRSHTKESVAEKENGGLAVLEQSSVPHHSNKSSFNSPYPDPGHINRVADDGTNKQDPPTNYEISHFPLIQGNIEDGNENFNGNVPSNVISSGRPIASQDHFRYPNTDNRYPPHDGISIYPRRHHINSDENGDILFFNNGIRSDSTTNISKPFDRNSHLAKLKLDNSNYEKDSEPTTTISPEFLNQLKTDHPNVHSSLLHLLPLYKPLGQEFDFPQESEKEDQSTNQSPENKQRGLESESHGSLAHYVPPTNKFIHFTDVNNASNDPDVSVNVLEIPKITKKFENIHNSSHSSILQHNNNDRLPNFSNVYQLPEGSHPDKSTVIHSDRTRNIFNPRQDHIPNYNRDRISINRNHFSESKIFTTTGSPVLTTREYLIPERTTPDTSYVPSVHTAFRNLEDFNSFQIFPSYIENNIVHTSTEANLNGFAIDKVVDLNAGKIPQDLTITTSYPLIKERENTNLNQRSDIPSESSNDKPIIRHFSDSKNQQTSFPLDRYNKTGEGIFPHKIRYQNALRDFRPDEIVIDIGNIPTHTPPPVTASFHQRILTTIQPTVKVFSAGNERSDANRRTEQASVTSWRRLIPTTKFPRRRTNDKSKIPAQSSSVSFVHRSPPNHNRNKFPSSHLNQLTGMRHFTPAHQTNRHQFYHPIPPSNVRMSPELNQLQHVSHLNNLPPGVSVHPRHPQAPFADMVHSNRPPTMPILNDGQESLKPHHRQRHHRKKDRMLHSCCRLRGNSGAFQSCCRNGGPCCSARSHSRFVQPSNCCSSSKVNRQSIPANQIQPHSRIANKILPSVRTEKTHRSEVDNKDRCQKEKMCRTLYESTQQVMVCRNAHVEGC